MTFFRHTFLVHTSLLTAALAGALLARAAAAPAAPTPLAVEQAPSGVGAWDGTVVWSRFEAARRPTRS
jgi:hypothetical protein